LKNDNETTKEGVVYALLAFTFWGLAPIYFKLLLTVLPTEILLHRVLWSLVFLLLALIFTKKLGRVLFYFKSPKIILLLTTTSLLVATNWGIYIWAINNDLLIEASLGYYINPLVNILLGFIFLKEIPTKAGKIAILLAVIAVLYQVYSIGKLPIISLSLATLFGFYGLIRKKISLPSLDGLFIETALITPIALIYWAYLFSLNESQFFINSTTTFLLILSGPVTILPLLAFNSAATRLKLSTIGYFQYLAPTISFLLAIIVYKEPLSKEKLITFLLIWLALALVTLETYFRQRKYYKRK